MVSAVVPLKNLTQAKSRLAPLLSDDERRGLVAAMLSDVLGALELASLVSDIFIVSDQPFEVPATVSRIPEVENRGYDAAVATAAADQRIVEARAMLVLPGDLPLANSDDIDVFVAGSPRKGARIAPARDGDGTNALLLAPPTLMRTQFGPGSFKRHHAQALSVASTVEIVAPPGLAFDMDTPQDLLDFCARDGDTETHGFLRRSGVRDRLTRTG